MLRRIVAVTFGIALAAAPGAAQTNHQHDHAQDLLTPEQREAVFQGLTEGETPGMMGGRMGESIHPTVKEFSSAFHGDFINPM